MTIVYDSSKRRITLSKEVGHGGEAIIYRVQGQDGLLAKIYAPPIHPHYEPKVAWMKDHPPEEPDYSIEIDEHQALAWPIELLYDAKGRFTGYLMPRIRWGVTLLKAFNPRLRAQALSFNRKYLHRIGRNLAAAVASLHAKGYVVGDLHESNVLVTSQALVTMIDTDSFQVDAVVNEEAVCYHCVVGKPEYTAPELQGKHLAGVTRKPEQDNFALAVLIFQLLMEGNHPFRSRWRRAGDPPSLEEKIARGLFPHVKPPPDPVTVPPNVPSLDTLYPVLSSLMQRCFVDGHKTPHLRPTAAEWRVGLEEAEAALVQCAKGHYRSDLLVECPRCEADKRVARRGEQAAVAGRRYGINFSPWLQQRLQTSTTIRHPTNIPQGQKKQTRTAQPQPTGSWSTITARTPTRQQAWIGIVVLAIMGICVLAFVADAVLPLYPRRVVVPAVTLEQTSTLFPTPFPTLSLLSGPPLSQSMVAISPENAKQVVQLDRWDHTSEVRGVAFSPDGTLLAARERFAVEVCEVATGRSVRSFSGYVPDSGNLAFSPDGALIAFGTNRIAEVWEVSTSRKVHGLVGHTDWVRSVAFSPDGMLLASGGGLNDQSIRLWSVLTGDEVRTLSEHRGDVDEVVFSPDGILLASGSADGTVKLWDVSTGSPLHTLRPDNGVNGVAFSPAGTLLAAGSRSETVIVYEVASGHRIHALDVSRVHAVAFSPDGTLLATASGDQTLKLWQVSTGHEVRMLSEDSYVYSVAFSPDGTLLASGSSSGAVTLWGIPPTSTLSSPTPVATPDADLSVLGGVVTDASTGLSISGANVTTSPSTASVTTGVDGGFAIPNVPPGGYTVTVIKLGYATEGVQVSVQAGEMTMTDIVLLALSQPSATPTLEVTPAPYPGGSP